MTYGGLAAASNRPSAMAIRASATYSISSKKGSSPSTTSPRSAAHCDAGPSTTFRFNYERPGCESGSPSADQTLTGATVVATHASSDFTLLELIYGVSFQVDTNARLYSSVTYMDLTDDQPYVYGDQDGSVTFYSAGMTVGF